MLLSAGMCAKPLRHRNVNIKTQLFIGNLLNIIPTIHKKYKKQNKQPKRKLVRQIILEITSSDM
jgi:hypothetical protein